VKVFVSGATGYIGTALVRALLAAGHEVVGLVRGKETPARPVIGDLKDPKTYEKAAGECDAIVHTGFEMGPDAVKTDRTAIDTFLRVARGPFVYTSGIWVLGATQGADEMTPVNPAPLVAWRPAHERLVLDAFSAKAPTIVVRPGLVMGGRGGLADGFFEGNSFVGTGENHWNPVHRDDLADLYLRAIETPLTLHDHRIFHATDGTREKTVDVARALARAAGKSAPQSWPLDEARKKLGAFADALAMDQVISSTHSERRLGWRPRIRGVVGNAARLFAERK